MSLDVDNDGEVTIGFYIPTIDIAKLVTFDNAHLVAQALTSNPEAARALYEELHYWASSNQI